MNSHITLSADKLTAYGDLATSYYCVVGLNGYSSNAIYYFEVVKNTAGYNQIGICTSASVAAILAGVFYLGQDTTSVSYFDYQSAGYQNGGFVVNGGSATTAGTMMCAFNPVTGRVWFGFNGTWFTGNPATNTSPFLTGCPTGTIYPAVGQYDATATHPQTCIAHFTSASWTYPSAATGCIAMT
jgi:hypothetical protein